MLTTSFPRFKGDSAGVFLFHFCQWLVKKGVNTTVIAPHDPGCDFTEKWGNIRIHRFPYFYPLQLQKLCYGSGIVKNIKNNLPAMLQLPFLCASEFLFTLAFLKKYKPDILHAHWTLPQGLIGIIAKRILKIPCVTSIHGSDVYSLKSSFFKTLNTIVIQNSDVCTVNSMATAAIARRVCGDGTAKVVPMGVDLECFSKTQDVTFLKRKFEIKGPVILFVGRLIDLKGTAYLIKAMPEILLRFPAAKALIIGSGPLKDELADLVQKLALKENVVFIDEMPQEELVAFYSLADIFVLPSIINEKGETEGLGVVLLEAMACGLPVIGCNVGGIPDIIRNGVTGLLIKQKDPGDLAEKSIQMMSDKALRNKVIQNGFGLIENTFSWEAISDKFIEVYNDILRGK
jgi:glycosyltransferase involved in cell wall biosynthesis